MNQVNRKMHPHHFVFCKHWIHNISKIWLFFWLLEVSAMQDTLELILFTSWHKTCFFFLLPTKWACNFSPLHRNETSKSLQILKFNAFPTIRILPRHVTLNISNIWLVVCLWAQTSTERVGTQQHKASHSGCASALTHAVCVSVFVIQLSQEVRLFPPLSYLFLFLSCVGSLAPIPSPSNKTL